MTRAALLSCLLTALLAGATGPTWAAQVGSTPSGNPAGSAASKASPVPLLAFYYSWFDTTSWRRAKIDYPALGRYTSDDTSVMRQHIRWAKAAGIDGFIVSWKDTPTNNRRLLLLTGVAREEHFKLAMIYQGLDFARKPLPVARVAADFDYFRTAFAADPVFYRLGGKPLTVWSGTWAFSHAEVDRVTSPVRDSLLVLNTEKNLAGYQRIADVTDGDAYYWSSVNPQTNTHYAAKLVEMSREIHRDRKFWIAPFAPGFDARKVGGTQQVPRRNGATMRTEYGVAMSSSPDLLGLISWNEFSENSYVEPSMKFGRRYLDVLADLRKAKPAQLPAAADSSAPGNGSGFPFTLPTVSSQAAVLVGLVGLFLLGVALLRPVVRRRDAAHGLLGHPAPHRALGAGPRGPGLPSGALPPGPPTGSWRLPNITQPPRTDEVDTPYATLTDGGDR